ncbi:beta-lactamase family protein [Roseomonas terrae]|uniref:Beta-lactamase family protein n=1 Tax=Neoroseomonas terrae TaxID=424799 RepID=A0ABS5EIY6_9PROT|nr:serine hydrolase domain-containing protein [Neoroseomonas terrae]MBR0650971.1 beta-lactamase family protein [Neoroseomonas terrae]
MRGQEQVALRMQAAVQAGDIPGVVVAAAGREDAGFVQGFGVRRLGGAEPMAPDTVVWIASMTKAVTAAAAMRLVEAKRLALDAPASEVLPEIGRIQVLDGFDADGKALLRAPRVAITLRHLLTHTSGFSYEMWSADTIKARRALGLPPMASGKLAALNLPLLFDPGEAWHYGIGVDWAGRMVEAVTGQSLGTHFAETIFAPLGMADTGFQLTDAMRARLAPIHARGPDGSLTPLERGVEVEREFDSGGGGLYSTARDYLAFARMILNGGRHGRERLLRPETIAMMAQDQIPRMAVQPMISAVPAASNDADFFPGQHCGWGLSFLINRHPSPQGRSAGGLAWAGMANCYYWIDHGRGTTGIFISQVLPFFDAKAVTLFRDFEATLNAA